MTPLPRIRRDEAARGGLVAAHLFFTVAGTVTGKAARDAIFLSRFTAQQMTALDLATTVAIALVVCVELRLLSRASTRIVLLLLPLVFAAGDLLLGAGLVLAQGDAWTPAAFLWIGVQAAVGAPHASLLAARLLTPREARRLCGLVGAGAIVGWIGGGLMTEAIAVRSGAASLLFVDGVLTAFGSAVVAIAWRRSAPTRTAESASPPQIATGGSTGASPTGLRGSASLVWTSPHLRAIACLAFVSAAVTTIAGLQFRAIASETIHSSNHLAAFFGSFSLRAGLVALVLQVLLTSRVVEWLGVGAALAIAPAALAAGSVGLWCTGSLAAAVLLKGSDQTLRYSVDRSAVELLYRPLSEREMFEGKIVIDALVSRGGDAAGGVIALVGATVLHVTFVRLSAVTIVLVFAWLAFTVIARRRYRARLLEPLRRTHVPAPPVGRAAAPAPRHGVLDPDPRVRTATLRALTESPARRAGAPIDEPLLTLALAAEVVGFAVLVEATGAADSANSAAAGAQPARATHDEGRDAIERIGLLLSLLYPARYPACLRAALPAENGRIEAAALEYLDNALDPPYRQLLVSCLERWNLAA